MIWLLLLVNLQASDVLTFEEIKRIQADTKKPKSTKTKSNNGYNSGKSLKKQLKEANKKLESYRYITQMQLKEPIIMEDVVIREADFIGAKSLLAIRATNSPQETIFTDLKSETLPEKSKIKCNVIVKHKRICGICNRIIIDGKGYNINATLNNRDGSPCVIGEVSDDGERYLTGVAATAIAQGVLSIGQTTQPTAFGNVIQQTGSNQLKQGLITAGQEATQIFRDEYQTREPIVTLAPNSPVVIQFSKEFSL